MPESCAGVPRSRNPGQGLPPLSSAQEPRDRRKGTEPCLLKNRQPERERGLVPSCFALHAAPLGAGKGRWRSRERQPRSRADSLEQSSQGHVYLSGMLSCFPEQKDTKKAVLPLFLRKR